MAKLLHPNEPGKWTLLAQKGQRALWRRDRSDPVPVTIYWLDDSPRQPELFYEEAVARQRLEALDGDRAVLAA